MEEDFGKILYEFLRENEMTQSYFAQRVGVKQSQVSEWLKGKAKPGYDTLKKISEALEVPADYFLGLTDTYWIEKTLRKFYGGFYFTA